MRAFFVVFLTAICFSSLALAQEEAPVAEPAEAAENAAENEKKEAAENEAEPEEILTQKEKDILRKQQQVAKERSEATSRFTRKAIERAEEREKKELERQQEREKRASRFQQQAMEEEARKVAEEKGLIAADPSEKSRFTLKAEQRAAERARKEQEKLDRKNRRRLNRRQATAWSD